MSRVTVTGDEFFEQFCHSLQSGGALLVSNDADGRPNVMTIGWAQLGVIWGRRICTVLVRPSRYTYDCCNLTGDFTVNIPYPSQADKAMLCGSKSGRDVDKFAACGFSAMPARSGETASPYIAECGLCYECDVVHFNDMIPENTSEDVVQGCYGSGDFHRIFFGEVLAAHADEDFAKRFAAELG